MKRYVFLLSLMFQTMIMADTKEEILSKIQQEGAMLDEMITKCHQKDMGSCRNVGIYFDKGGIYDIAYSFLKKACDGNNSSACVTAGIYKSLGKKTSNTNNKNDVQVDSLMGIKYFQKACNLGDDLGCELLNPIIKKLRVQLWTKVKDPEIITICRDTKGKEYELTESIVFSSSDIVSFFEGSCTEYKR